MLLHFKKLDWIMIVSAVLLAGIGLLSIWSSSFGRGDFLNFKKQLFFLGIGFFLMVIISFFDWRALRENSYLILALYFISCFSLLGLIFFAPEIRGVKSWYRFGDISIHPVEFVKIILIILLAKHFSLRHIEMYRIKHIFQSGLYVLLPALLIFFQPDMGQIIILTLLWLGILIVSGLKIRHFLLLILFFLLVIVSSWFTVLRDYQKERLMSFLIPYEPLGVSWSQNQSKIAIGSGGLFGQGIKKGGQTQYGFLPESQTDFIFAAIAEETGLIGVLLLLILFSILLWRIMRLAFFVRTNFPRLFATGLAILLVSQIFISIGMNLGLAPVIGISLPLVSYGGSGLIATFIGLGILQSIKSNS
ncbi:rod shape-determining protein RodA [Patescibacteria group bacterium]|nr:rod shape-determining protein RodA [Patescibacteria group bacterium]